MPIDPEIYHIHFEPAEGVEMECDVVQTILSDLRASWRKVVARAENGEDACFVTCGFGGKVTVRKLGSELVSRAEMEQYVSKRLGELALECQAG